MSLRIVPDEGSLMRIIAHYVFAALVLVVYGEQV